MLAIIQKLIKAIFGRKQVGLKYKKGKTRFLHLEPLEERQLLSVSQWNEPHFDTPVFEDQQYISRDDDALFLAETGVLTSDLMMQREYAPEIETIIPDDIEPNLDAEGIAKTVIDEIYGELTFEQFYQLHNGIALQRQMSQLGLSGPLTFNDYCLLSNQSHLLQNPSYTPGGMTPFGSPQHSPGSGIQYTDTYIVDTLLDVVNANDGMLSLREAVALANGSSGRDLITFANGLQGMITLNGTQLALTDNVDIIGPGSGQLTISGNNQSRIFYSGITGKTITLEGLTLTNGHSIGSGGAVSFDYASGVLRDVVIINSSATTSGGGIYAGYSSNLIIENCVVENNAATSSYGGGIQTIYCYNVAISDSVITDNESYYGGGIGLYANVQNTIDNTIIRNNTSYAGGGIYATRPTVSSGTSYVNDTTITNSQIVNNTAAAHAGGAFFQYSENVTVAGSMISGNAANTACGGIYFYASGHSLVTGSTIANNSAITHGGGVMINHVTSDVFATLLGEVEIIDTTISGNVSGWHGGGIYLDSYSSMILESSLIANNTARDDGGGIYSHSAMAINNTTISGNKAETIDGQTSNNTGGGMYFGSPTAVMTLTNSTITNNTAYSGAGVVTSTSAGVQASAFNTIIAGNTGSANDGRHDAYGRVMATSSHNLIGIATGLAGITNGTNNNQIGTAATPLNPKLGILRDNGGPTLTHALQDNSPAIDAGSVSFAVNHRGDVLIYDQRGRAYRRTAGTTIDIGAFERDTEVEIDASQEYYIINSDETLQISPAEIALNSADLGGADLVVQITESASHGTIVVLTDGSVAYTPTAGYIGMDTIEYAVARKDGMGATTGTITIEVCPGTSSTANTGTFQAVNDTATIFNNTTANYIDVLKNDVFSTTQYGQIISVGTSTKGAVAVVQKDGRDMISFTPNAGATGTTSVTYTVRNSNGTTKTATLSITLMTLPSFWQGSNLAIGDIALGGSAASLTPGNGFTPMYMGNTMTTFSGTGAMNSIMIPGEDAVSGTGNQETTVNIASIDFGSGNYWYSEHVHWSYSITDDVTGDHYDGSYTYTLIASKINGVEQYSLNVISTDHYDVTVTTNTSNSTMTERQTGTTKATIRLGETYTQLTNTVNGYDYRTTDIIARSVGAGTYQYAVVGGIVFGSMDSTSRATNKESTHCIYHGTKGNVSITWGIYHYTAKEDSDYDFGGSGTTLITNASGSTSTVLTTSVLNGEITEFGRSGEKQNFRVSGQYHTLNDQWYMSGSGTVDSNSYSKWKENSTETKTEITDTPTNKRNYSVTQTIKNTHDTDSKLEMAFKLENGQWVLKTGAGRETQKTSNDSNFTGSGTYEQSGTGSGCDGSPFDHWHKAGTFSDAGGMNQEAESTVRSTYSNSTGLWSRSGTGSTTGSNDYSSEYFGTGTYAKEISLGSSYGGSDGKIQFTQGETTENGEYQTSRDSTTNSVMDNNGNWTSTGTANETVSGSDDTTYFDSDGVFTIASLNITGDAYESGENHESFTAALNYTIQNENWQQVGGVATNHSSMMASFSYSGSGTTTDIYEAGTLISRTGGTANYSSSGSGCGDGSGSSEPTAYRKTIEVHRSIDQSQSEENETDTVDNYINNTWKTVSGNGTASGDNTSIYDENYSGTYDKGHRTWNQSSSTAPDSNGDWSYVSGTLSGTLHSSDHTDYETKGTWNASVSKWDTSGTLNASFDDNSHDESSGSGNYLNVRSVGESGANNYSRQSQSGTITESSLDHTTHSGHSKSVWGNTGANTEGWLLASGSTTNTGNGETEFSTEGSGTFSWMQNVYGTASVAEVHTASGSTSNSSYSFSSYNYSETYTPQAVTRNNVTMNEWVLTKGSGAATQNSVVSSATNEIDNYRKKMDTNFDAFNGRQEDNVSETTEYHETLNFGLSEFNLNEGKLPTLVAVSGTATLTEDGTTYKSEAEFDRYYAREIKHNNIGVGEVKGFVGNTKIETEDYHFVSDFEFKTPSTSSSGSSSGSGCGCGSGSGTSTVLKQWVHTSGTGQQTLSYNEVTSYAGSGNYHIEQNNSASSQSNDVYGTITESGTIKGSTSGSGAIYNYTFTEGNTEWKVVGSSGLTTENSNFHFTETRSGSYSNGGMSGTFSGTASWDYESVTMTKVDDVSVGQNKGTCTETVNQSVTNSFTGSGNDTIFDDYFHFDITGTGTETGNETYTLEKTVTSVLKRVASGSGSGCGSGCSSGTSPNYEWKYASGTMEETSSGFQTDRFTGSGSGNYYNGCGCGCGSGSGNPIAWNVVDEYRLESDWQYEASEKWALNAQQSVRGEKIVWNTTEGTVSSAITTKSKINGRLTNGTDSFAFRDANISIDWNEAYSASSDLTQTTTKTFGNGMWNISGDGTGTDQWGYSFTGSGSGEYGIYGSGSGSSCGCGCGSGGGGGGYTPPDTMMTGTISLFYRSKINETVNQTYTLSGSSVAAEQHVEWLTGGGSASGCGCGSGGNPSSPNWKVSGTSTRTIEEEYSDHYSGSAVFRGTKDTVPIVGTKTESYDFTINYTGTIEGAKGIDETQWHYTSATGSGTGQLSQRNSESGTGIYSKSFASDAGSLTLNGTANYSHSISDVDDYSISLVLGTDNYGNPKVMFNNSGRHVIEKDESFSYNGSGVTSTTTSTSTGSTTKNASLTHSGSRSMNEVKTIEWQRANDKYSGSVETEITHEADGSYSYFASGSSHSSSENSSTNSYNEYHNNSRWEKGISENFSSENTLTKNWDFSNISNIGQLESDTYTRYSQIGRADGGGNRYSNGENHSTSSGCSWGNNWSSSWYNYDDTTNSQHDSYNYSADWSESFNNATNVYSRSVNVENDVSGESEYTNACGGGYTHTWSNNGCGCGCGCGCGGGCGSGCTSSASWHYNNNCGCGYGSGSSYDETIHAIGFRSSNYTNPLSFPGFPRAPQSMPMFSGDEGYGCGCGSGCGSGDAGYISGYGISFKGRSVNSQTAPSSPSLQIGVDTSLPSMPSSITGDGGNSNDNSALRKAGFDYWNSPMIITPIKTASWYERTQVWAGEWLNYFASDAGRQWVHTGLDVLGMIPYVGSVADVLNAGIYYYEGKYGMMVLNLSTAAMGLSGIPAAKWASNGAKFAGAGAKTACLVGKAVKAAPYAAAVVASGYQANESFKEGKYLEGTLHIVSALAFGYRGAGALKNAKFCFTEGTQIVVGMGLADDGTVLYDTKNIEDIQVGDLVYSYNTLTGETELTEVTSTFALRSDHINYLTVVDEDGVEQTLETTDSHPFWVVTDDPDLERAAQEVVDENGVILYHENLEPGLNGFWVEAKDLKIGDVFLGANGELSTLTNIVRVEQEGGIAVFNFTVDGNHNYFILAKEYEYGQSCVLVHNAKYDGPGSSRPHIRKATKDALKVDGQYRDADGNIIKNAVLGHKKGLEYWRMKLWAEARGLTRKQWNNLQNRPEIYRLEDALSNASHKDELIGGGIRGVTTLLKKTLGNNFMKYL